jgi:glycosidase
VRNVATEKGDPASMLTLHQRLLALRRGHAALALGEMMLGEAAVDVLTYERRLGADRLWIALNMGDRPQTTDAPAWAAGGRVLLSTLDDPPPWASSVLSLRPNEGVIIAPADIEAA